MDSLSADLTSSWKHLRAIARQETSSDSTSMDKKLKSAQSLTDAAERLRVLETIHKRVFNRFEKMLLYMGVSPTQLNKWKVMESMPGFWSNFKINKKSNFDWNQLKLSTQHKYMYMYQKKI